jgi:hypothetical protein
MKYRLLLEVKLVQKHKIGYVQVGFESIIEEFFIGMQRYLFLIKNCKKNLGTTLTYIIMID